MGEFHLINNPIDFQNTVLLCSIYLSIYPVVRMTVGTQQMIWQPALFNCLANCLGSPSFSLYHSLPSLSILGCCLPIFSSACLAFCLLALCLARLFWQVLMIVRHGCTTSVFFFSQWPEDLHVARALVARSSVLPLRSSRPQDR